MFRKSFLSFVAFAAALVSVACFALPTVSADEDPTANARAVFKYLKNRDYKVEYDPDGDLVFEYENQYYLVVFDQNDDEYFRIIYPNCYTFENEIEFIRSYVAAQHVNNTVKGVKMMIPEKFVEDPQRLFDSPAIAVESFHYDVSDFTRTIQRSISTLQTAAKKFNEVMEE